MGGRFVAAQVQNCVTIAWNCLPTVLKKFLDLCHILNNGACRNVAGSTIIQNMAQIKELFKDSWETIPGNSDTILYLGGNESSTHKYISEALGKATIDTRTHGQTKGKSGSYSTNFQMSGRDVP